MILTTPDNGLYRRRMLNREIAGRSAEYRHVFATARPFKHVLIDNFLDPQTADALLHDFPAFDPKRAMNELGQVGKKAVVENIELLGPTYAALSDYLKSGPFLAWMGGVTGIHDLLPDPNFFGGGTHENLHGQELDAHVDFNYDPPTKAHRRLNLLVYLNKEWREEWGGSIELHSNPRKPETNEIIAFVPIFNRALVFETNEHSWHGFPIINLPPDKRHLSRKSISVYLYSKERPAEEIVPEHGTFYVQRPLPPQIRPGHVVTEQDVTVLKDLLSRRDVWIEKYQRDEIRVSSDMGTMHGEIDQLRGRSLFRRLFR